MMPVHPAARPAPVSAVASVRIFVCSYGRHSSKNGWRSCLSCDVFQQREDALSTRRRKDAAARSELALVLSAAEEARPEATVLERVQLGFEADALFVDSGLLFDKLDLLLHEALAFGLELCLLLFEGGDGLLLQFALELEQVEEFDLAPQAVYLRASGVP